MKTLWQQRKKWIIAGAAVLAVALAFLVAGPLLFMTNATATTSGEIERVEVFVGDLSSEATASGELTARQRAALAPLTTGTVDEVLVAVGDEVGAGDPLLRLDTAGPTRDVATARQALVAVALVMKRSGPATRNASATTRTAAPAIIHFLRCCQRVFMMRFSS